MLTERNRQAERDRASRLRLAEEGVLPSGRTDAERETRREWMREYREKHRDRLNRQRREREARLKKDDPAEWRRRRARRSEQMRGYYQRRRETDPVEHRRRLDVYNERRRDKRRL